MNTTGCNVWVCLQMRGWRICNSVLSYVWLSAFLLTTTNLLPLFALCWKNTFLLPWMQLSLLLSTTVKIQTVLPLSVLSGATPCTILIVTNCFVFIFSLGIALQRLNYKSVETKNNLHQRKVWGRNRTTHDFKQIVDRSSVQSDSTSHCKWIWPNPYY